VQLVVSFSASLVDRRKQYLQRLKDEDPFGLFGHLCFADFLLLGD
jgi:hypothetical protein